MSLVRFRPEAPLADLAHLVERRLAKAKVAGSSPVIRLKKQDSNRCPVFLREVKVMNPGELTPCGNSPLVRLSRRGMKRNERRTSGSEPRNPLKTKKQVD